MASTSKNFMYRNKVFSMQRFKCIVDDLGEILCCMSPLAPIPVHIHLLLCHLHAVLTWILIHMKTQLEGTIRVFYLQITCFFLHKQYIYQFFYKDRSRLSQNWLRLVNNWSLSRLIITGHGTTLRPIVTGLRQSSLNYWA